MPTRHLGSLAKNSSTRLRDNFCRKATCPAASTPCTRKTDFAISNPIVVTCFIVVLLSTHPQIMLREGRESRPHHQKRTNLGVEVIGLKCRVRRRTEHREAGRGRRIADRVAPIVEGG